MRNAPKSERITEQIFRLILWTGIGLILIPSILYIFFVFLLNYTVSLDIATFFMVFSATSNMAIWIIAVITAYKSSKATEKYSEYADSILSNLGFIPPTNGQTDLLTEQTKEIDEY